MIYYLFLLITSAQVQECNWDYGIPNEHNKHTDGDVRRNLIVDGQASQPHEYPWQVSIEPIGCGGSIISREYILSAAHCVSGTPTVVAGLNRYRIRGTWIPHELYNDNNIENDIAVIKLDQPLPCDDPTINAIALPELLPGFSLDECTAWVTGFGALREDGPSPPGYSMHEVQTKVFSTDYCNAAPENIFTLPQTQICGFTPGKPTEDSCQGDSGGPFKIDINADSKAYHKYVQVGIVSYGAGCGRTAGIYTDVSEYKQWVLGKVPTARFEKVSACDKESYHEGIIDCEGRNCRLEAPYCLADSSTWRSEQGTSCSSYTNIQFSCFADKGDNLFASQVCPQCGYCQQGQENTQLILTDEVECDPGFAPVDIEITTADWAKEISFAISDNSGDHCVGSGFQNHANYTSTCCIPQGDHTVSCRDAYGDGWHGAQLLVDGELMCGEFEAELQVDSLVVSFPSAKSESNGGAIAAGIVVPLLFIALLCACWFYIWPAFGHKAMDILDDCCASKKTYDPESRAPLSPQVKSEFAYPAPVAPAAGSRNRGSSYWTRFHTGPAPSTSAFPKAPSVAARAKMFGKRTTAPPPPPANISITWYYDGGDGNNRGPVSDAELKSKIGSEIKEDTYVWNGETVDDWTYANDVPELKKILAQQKVNADDSLTWHYVDASGNDVGPVSDKIFKARIGKTITKETYVWNGTTVNDWTNAGDVSELNALFKPLSYPSVPKRPVPSRFLGKGTTNFAMRNKETSRPKAAFATKRQASTKSNGVSNLIARFNQN